MFKENEQRLIATVKAKYKSMLLLNTSKVYSHQHLLRWTTFMYVLANGNLHNNNADACFPTKTE